MIPGKKELKLIRIYMYICDLYDQVLKYYNQRYSYNSSLAFADQEIMTIHLFAGHCQKYFQIMDIYNFADDCERGISLVDSLSVNLCRREQERLSCEACNDLFFSMFQRTDNPWNHSSTG